MPLRIMSDVLITIKLGLWCACKTIMIWLTVLCFKNTSWWLIDLFTLLKFIIHLLQQEAFILPICVLSWNYAATKVLRWIYLSLSMFNYPTWIHVCIWVSLSVVSVLFWLSALSSGFLLLDLRVTQRLINLRLIS